MRSHAIGRRLAALLLLVSAKSLHAQSRSVTDSAAHVAVTALLASARVPVMRWPTINDVVPDLQQLYATADTPLLWSRNGVASAPSRAIVNAIHRLDVRGLDPHEYDAAYLDSVVAAPLTTLEARSMFDAVLSVNALRVLNALRNGRIAPTDAHATLQLPRDVVDQAATLVSLVHAAVADSVFDAQEPPYVHYQLLKRALARYQALARADATIAPYVRQIALTLERWRWLPHHFETSPIIVNIPAFRLHVLAPGSDRENEMLTMDVVVGDAYNHQTPVFSGVLDYLVFAPYWDVPPAIAKAELVPIAARDPYLLTLNNYEIVSAAERVIPTTPAAIRAVAAGRARIRQLPGGSNALGRVKFMFPNEFDVYLHDTPVQTAFERTRRDLSHGCIRVADPVALARLLLRDQPQWDAAAIDAAMAAVTPQRVDLLTRVPVHVIYITAIASEDGTVTFYDDIYQLDTALATLLTHGYPYRR